MGINGHGASAAEGAYGGFLYVERVKSLPRLVRLGFCASLIDCRRFVT